MKPKATPTPYDLNKTVLPAIFLSSPMFSPRRNGNCARTSTSFSSVRNKNEKLTYIGYQLDCDLDFRIYSLIISKSLLRDDFSINLTMKEFFDVLNTHKNDRHVGKFRKYLKRLDLFQKSTFLLEYNEDEVCKRQDIKLDLFRKKTKSHKLIDDYLISEDGKSVKIYIDYDIRSHYFSPFDKEIVDLKHFSEIEDQYNKSLYLLFLTKKFKNNSFFYISKNELYNRISINTKLSDSKIKSMTHRILVNLLKFKFFLNFDSYSEDTFIFYKKCIK